MSEAFAKVPGQTLPRLARAAIAERLEISRRMDRTGLDARLLELGASFVTLRLEGSLRGCVGSLEASRPLADDVEANALAAGFEDPRFPPLTSAEYELVRIGVSVLGPLVPLPAADQAELVERLTPGEDGLVLSAGDRRATFLPQVWDALPEPDLFLEQLRLKAGVEGDLWTHRPSFYTYRVREWQETDRLRDGNR